MALLPPRVKVPPRLATEALPAGLSAQDFAFKIDLVDTSGGCAPDSGGPVLARLALRFLHCAFHDVGKAKLNTSRFNVFRPPVKVC